MQAQSRRRQKTVVMVIKAGMGAGGCVDKPGWMGIILKMMAARGGGWEETDAGDRGRLGVIEVVEVWGC